jgi:hypothetical protein
MKNLIKMFGKMNWMQVYKYCKKHGLSEIGAKSTAYKYNSKSKQQSRFYLFFLYGVR